MVPNSTSQGSRVIDTRPTEIGGMVPDSSNQGLKVVDTRPTEILLAKQGSDSDNVRDSLSSVDSHGAPKTLAEKMFKDTKSSSERHIVTDNTQKLAYDPKSADKRQASDYSPAPKQNVEVKRVSELGNSVVIQEEKKVNKFNNT
jgi:hypothetical protein